jgi:glycosyltransferase involved in cell wall biosynthesis
MNNFPKVSVLIPTYNSAIYLIEAIESVLNQTFSDFELIIVDNCSTDNTDEVVSKYLSDPRIIYKKNETNLGVVGNFNLCLSYASGQYIKFLCADDKFFPHLLEKFVAVMDNYPGVSLVTSWSQGFGANSRIWKAPFENLQDGKKIIHKVLEDYNWLGCPTQVMFRRSNLWLGEFKKLKCLIDLEMWVRHLSIGDCYLIPEPLSYGRDHADSITQREVMKNYTMVYESYDLCKAISQNNVYRLNFTEAEINSLLKKKAITCTLIIPHMLLKNRKKENFSLMTKSLKIARKEKVLLFALWLIGIKTLAHLLPLGTATHHLPEIYG